MELVTDNLEENTMVRLFISLGNCTLVPSSTEINQGPGKSILCSS